MEIYNLVVQYQLGNYDVIDLNELVKLMPVRNNIIIGNSLKQIDDFTSEYTLNEITDAIIKSNMTTNKFNSDNLRVVSNHKLNHSVKKLSKILMNLRKMIILLFLILKIF